MLNHMEGLVKGLGEGDFEEAVKEQKEGEENLHVSPPLMFRNARYG